MAKLTLSSWRGSSPLGPIPIVSGSWKVTAESGVTVPGSIEFAVPAEDPWIPATYNHPIAGMGQRVWAQVDQDNDAGPFTWGWFRLDRPKRAGSVIQCTGRGLLREIERYRLPTSMQVEIGTSRTAVLRQLLAGCLPLVVSGVADTLTTALVTWEESRIDALWEVIESWPARAEMREQALWVLPAWDDANPGIATVDLIDGPGGTLISLEPPDDDTDPFNAYVVSTVPSGEEAAVTRMWTMPTGPMAWGGPYGYNPGFYSSPLNPTDPAALLAIGERLTRREISVGTTLTFTARPEVSASVGAIAHVRSSRLGVDGIGRITALALTSSALSGSVAML